MSQDFIGCSFIRFVYFYKKLQLKDSLFKAFSPDSYTLKNVKIETSCPFIIFLVNNGTLTVGFDTNPMKEIKNSWNHEKGPTWSHSIKSSSISKRSNKSYKHDKELIFCPTVFTVSAIKGETWAG